jgi:hypothetical protein
MSADMSTPNTSTDVFRPVSDSDRCTAHINIAGADYRCDMTIEHDGWAHGSKEAQAVWDGPTDV